MQVVRNRFVAGLTLALAAMTAIAQESLGQTSTQLSQGTLQQRTCGERRASAEILADPQCGNDAAFAARGYEGLQQAAADHRCEMARLMPLSMSPAIPAAPSILPHCALHRKERHGL